MKKTALLILMTLTVSLIFAQSPCCKNKGEGVSCTRSVQAVDVSQKNDAPQTVDANKALPACCKSKSEQGVSCSNNKKGAAVESYSSKKWWQIWKKG